MITFFLELGWDTDTFSVSDRRGFIHKIWYLNVHVVTCRSDDRVCEFVTKCPLGLFHMTITPYDGDDRNLGILHGHIRRRWQNHEHALR